VKTEVGCLGRSGAPYGSPADWQEATLEDDSLVMLARSGDEQALLELLDRYKGFARVKARSYFIVGGDREDIIQEGMIGLYKAIRDYRSDRQSCFRAFAELCVTRQIITAIKTATRQKHVPLNSYVSLSRPACLGEDPERPLAEVLSGPQITDPAELVESADELRALRAYFEEILSDLEAEVLTLYVDGRSYQEIAASLDRHVKSIDNALQRIKRKLTAHLARRQLDEAC